MCGIAVHSNPHKIAEPLDLSTLHHRGPDGSGEWTSKDGHVWLGATRLAILDLSTNGDQPMHDTATGNVIVFNGEIYNHRELRRELSDVHPTWHGTGDTETLLAAYHHWGTAMLGKLKGMFAFCIYDAKEKSLLIARDRLGIKPLYYYQENNSIKFASEIKTIIKEHHLHTNPDAVSAYLQWGACRRELLIYPQIQSFPAGHWMKISEKGINTLGRYWPPASLCMNGTSQNATENSALRVRELLELSVGQHLLSDVPVAVFLSGGIDSSIITALAAQSSTEPLHTFSVGFADTHHDETDIAEEVARRYNTKHTRIELSQEEVIETVKEAVLKLDLPSSDAINTYIVSKEVARRGIKVALSGLGGDELFGGYPSFRDVPKLKILMGLSQKARRPLSLFGHFGSRLADMPAKRDAAILTHWRRKMWTDEMLRDAGLPVVPFELPVSPDLPDDYSRISWAELTGYMRHMLLRDSDQMSMAVSLELRVPFLDHELVEYVLGIRAQQKKEGPYQKTLLLEACKDLLPRSVYNRRKMGFELPMDTWIRGPLKAFVEEGLRKVNMSGAVSESVTASMNVQFDVGKLHWTRLWGLVVLGWYLGAGISHD